MRMYHPSTSRGAAQHERRSLAHEQERGPHEPRRPPARGPGGRHSGRRGAAGGAHRGRRATGAARAAPSALPRLFSRHAGSRGWAPWAGSQRRGAAHGCSCWCRGRMHPRGGRRRGEIAFELLLFRSGRPACAALSFHLSCAQHSHPCILTCLLTAVCVLERRLSELECVMGSYLLDPHVRSAGRRLRRLRHGTPSLPRTSLSEADSPAISLGQCL